MKNLIYAVALIVVIYIQVIGFQEPKPTLFEIITLFGIFQLTGKLT